MRQVILFETLVPILAGTQGFLIGLFIDALTRSRLAKASVR
jgi:hypothetical protein